MVLDWHWSHSLVGNCSTIGDGTSAISRSMSSKRHALNRVTTGSVELSFFTYVNYIRYSENSNRYEVIHYALFKQITCCPGAKVHPPLLGECFPAFPRDATQMVSGRLFWNINTLPFTIPKIVAATRNEIKSRDILEADYETGCWNSEIILLYRNLHPDVFLLGYKN